jgi:hypothetical protein
MQILQLLRYVYFWERKISVHEIIFINIGKKKNLRSYSTYVDSNIGIKYVIFTYK